MFQVSLSSIIRYKFLLYLWPVSNLEPGVYLELQDLNFPFRSDNGTLKSDHVLFQWSEFMLEASTKAGKPLDRSSKFEDLLKDVGFVNVKVKVLKWPSNSWPKNKTEKTLGIWQNENLNFGIEGFLLALFTRILGWGKEEVDVFLAKVRKDIKDRSIHSYLSMCISILSSCPKIGNLTVYKLRHLWPKARMSNFDGSRVNISIIYPIGIAL